MRPIDEVLSQPGGLAERLYALRKAAGLPVGVLAEQLGWVPSKVSKLQRGQQKPTAADVQAWADACGHPEAASELLDLLAEAEAVHWRWQQRLARGHPSVQEDLARQERQAKRIRAVQVTVLPGLLQTAAYARHMIVMFRKIQGAGLEDVDATVAARMRRQEILYEPDREFEFVLTENILRRRVGDRAVMGGQMDRLIQLAGLPNISLGIIPDDAEGLEVFPWVGFLMLDAKVILDGMSGEDRDSPADVAVYERMMDAALAAAVTGDQAVAFVREVAESLA